MKFDDLHTSARPYIACFVLLRRNEKIAMVLRKNTGWMDGFWGLPAGKVEYFEHFTAGAIREAKEEAGITLKEEDLHFVHVAHRHNKDAKRNTFVDWVDVYFQAKAWLGEPYNAEPEKSEELAWLELPNLPKNVVPSQRKALECILKNELYSEFGWEKI